MSEIKEHINQDQHIQKVESFFDQWNIYQKVIKNNYMFHEQIHQIIHELLLEHFNKKPFSLLDLGCGDSSSIAKTIKDIPISYYHGIDISEIALETAKENFASYSFDKVFSHGDFFEIINQSKTKFDVILSGYSLHHLQIWQKDIFFGSSREILKKGGLLLIYDQIKKYDETRDKYLERYWDNCNNNRKEMTAEELKNTKKHIFEGDFPENIETFMYLVNKHRFWKTSILYRDPPLLLGLICFI